MRIAILPGDGIGKDVTKEAVKVLRAVMPNAELLIGDIGLSAIDVKNNDTFPARTRELVDQADAVLFGATGESDCSGTVIDGKTTSSLLALRKQLGLFANIRPIMTWPELHENIPFKYSSICNTDFIVIRELAGGLYYGEPRGIKQARENQGRVGFNTLLYSEEEVERIAHLAFKLARKRKSRVCSVDKANVLESMQLWRDVMTRVANEYPDVELTHLYIDAAVMHMMRSPASFDVFVMDNLFGDIFSDAAAMLTGSLGMLPSASLGCTKKGLYEPVHGSAPDIAGQDIANPIGSILSVALMLLYSFDAPMEAKRIFDAVHAVLADGLRTADIARVGDKYIGTEMMGNAVVNALKNQ